VWHKNGIVPSRRASSPAPPLNGARLDALALRYVGRYATTRAKLIAYLERKLRQHGWAGDELPAPGGLADRLVDLGYIDDAAFAAMRSASMQRRGYGARRIGAALGHAGIARDTADSVAPDENARWMAAERFAQRKRLGKFSDGPLDPKMRQKHFAAMIRAGHDFETAKHFIRDPESDVGDAND
jgi:regulatory protein